MAERFGGAYNRVASVDKCVSGFKAGGIWPLNSVIFEEEDFVASEHLVGKKVDAPAVVAIADERVIIEGSVAEVPAFSGNTSNGHADGSSLKVVPAATFDNSTASTSTSNHDQCVGTSSDGFSEVAGDVHLPGSTDGTAEQSVHAIIPSEVSSIAHNSRVPVSAISSLAVPIRSATARKAKCK